MSRLKTIFKTVIRYVILYCGIIVVFTLLSYLYIYTTGKAARKFCEQVNVGMKVEKLQSFAVEKGLDVKRKSLGSQNEDTYIFLVSPNLESQCSVVVREGHVINKKYFQYL